MLLHKDREQFEAVLNAVSNELGVLYFAPIKGRISTTQSNAESLDS